MKKLYTLSFLMLALVPMSWAQNFGILLFEDFETGTLPTDWTRTQIPGSDGWTFGETSYSSSFWDVPPSIDNSQFAISNDDACDCDMSDDQLLSPVMDWSNFDSVYVLYDRFYDAAWGSLAYAQISYDAGATWLYLAIAEDPAWVEDGFALPAEIVVDNVTYAFNDQMMIGFLHDDGGAWADGFAIDNVIVAGFNNPCDDIITITGCDQPQTVSLGGQGVLDFNFTGACLFDVPGAEQLYSFTPTVSGVHTLDVTATTEASWLDYMFKPASLGCDSLGWTCLSDVITPGSFGMNLTAGVEYVILVDNEFADLETQTFSISCPCTYTSGGNTPESENCGADLNGGCNSDPAVYESIACGQSISGTLWADGGNRDTDWFELVVTENTTIDVDFSAAMPVNVFLIDNCTDVNVLENSSGTACGSGSFSYAATPGTYVMVIAPTAFESYPCGSGSNAYDLTVTYCELVTGIDASAESGFQVYPNPSNGDFVLETTVEDGMAQLNVVDVAGRMVYKETFVANGAARRNISLDVTSGTYTLQLITSQGVYSQRLVVH